MGSSELLYFSNVNPLITRNRQMAGQSKIEKKPLASPIWDSPSCFWECNTCTKLKWMTWKSLPTAPKSSLEFQVKKHPSLMTLVACTVQSALSRFLQLIDRSPCKISGISSSVRSPSENAPFSFSRDFCHPVFHLRRRSRSSRRVQVWDFAL